MSPFSRKKVYGDEMPDKVALLVGNILSHPYRALSFQKTQYACHTVFGWNADEHMHVIGHQRAFFHDTLLLLRSPVQHVFQVPTDHPIEDFLAILGCKNYVVLAFPCAMVQVLGVCRHGRSPCNCFERSKHSGRSSAYVKHRDSSREL